MKTLWICGLLLLITVHGRTVIDVSDAGGLPPVEQGAPAPLPPLAANQGETAAADLSVYLYLHETRDSGIPLQLAAHMNACPE